MASSSYQPLPTSANADDPPATYPPTPPSGPLSSLRSSIPFLGGSSNPHTPLPGPPYPLHPPKARLTPTLVLKYILAAAGGLVIFHYVVVGAFPESSYTTTFREKLGTSESDRQFQAAAAAAEDVLSRLDPAALQPGTFFRDSFPIRSMLAFWELAEKEVEARGLNTCHGQLGRELVEAYHSSEVAYCEPPGSGEGRFEPAYIRNDSHTPHWTPETGEPVPPTTITCLPVQDSSFSKWWPYPAAPCLSTNLRAEKGEQRKFRAAGCEVTDKGFRLKKDMGRERFLGGEIDLTSMEDEGAECKERIERTLVVIGRQDQWNPFHVAEDLITTLVTIFIAARTAPALINTRVQLVFSEGFGMDQNHFTPLWDRIGAWAPRRLSLDPWGEGVCLTNTIHSVGAGASLLSAMGVGSSYTCASTITWAASHYYRHLFGISPPSLLLPETLLESHHASRPRRPINVLWLSRAKLDQYAQSHNDWSSWRDVRHINNEPELIAKFRSGLAGLCAEGSTVLGEQGCAYEDAQDVPESWALTAPGTIESDEAPLPVRFAVIDPTVHALETQIHFVGHTTILVSSHGGALGLSLFLPPGDGTLIELQVESVAGNFHFQHMAYEMGHNYEVLNINRDVDVEQVWELVERRVKVVAQSG
ncbi:hypothetical protein IAT38_005653 [Cryptococcus sp. DSM 104549]